MNERPVPLSPIPPQAVKVFEGVLFDVYQWQQELYDGSITTFEKLRRKRDSVTIIPVVDAQNILITHERQIGSYHGTSIPGGMIEAGEEPIVAARRELLEETGYESSRWELWYSRQIAESIDWVSYVFIAKDCRRVTAPNPGAGEKVEIQSVGLEDFISVASQESFRINDVGRIALKASYDQVSHNDLKRIFFC